MTDLSLPEENLVDQVKRLRRLTESQARHYDQVFGNLRREIETDDRLLEERNKILDRLPCPLHGRCVPHVLETIDRLERHVKRQHVGSWAIWKLMNRWRPPCGRGPKIRSPRSMSATKRAKRGGE